MGTKSRLELLRLGVKFSGRQRIAQSSSHKSSQAGSSAKGGRRGEGFPKPAVTLQILVRPNQSAFLVNLPVHHVPRSRFSFYPSLRCAGCWALLCKKRMPQSANRYADLHVSSCAFSDASCPLELSPALRVGACSFLPD